jgi:hypothetical protein
MTANVEAQRYFKSERVTVPALGTITMQYTFKPDQIVISPLQPVTTGIWVYPAGAQGGGGIPVLTQNPISFPGTSDDQTLTIVSKEPASRDLLIVASKGHAPVALSSAAAVYSGDALEAAARFGAIGIYTRAGKAIYATSFEDGLAGWTKKIFGTGAVAIDNTLSFHGGASVKLTPNSVTDWSAIIEKRFPLIYRSRYGIETLFSMDPAATGWEMFVGFLSQKYASVPQYAVKYDKPSDTLKYLDSGGTFTTFATGLADLRTEAAGTPLWVLAKLVVNADYPFGYHAFILNDVTYDMRALDFRNTASASTNPRLTVQLWAFDTGGANKPTWADCFLLTTDEPPYVS